MMDETYYMILSFAGGILLGIIFFGGLWFTVKKVVASKMPALWILTSFILRISSTLFGFYFIGSSNWQRLLLCTIGFIIARSIVLRYTKSNDEQIAIKMEANHET
ncbi:N-ATPase subunit AtpR [Flavitalea flava]